MKRIHSGILEKHFVVLDDKGEPAGALDLALCPDLHSLNKELNFRGLENWAKSLSEGSPAELGFRHFRKQLPKAAEIYPVAVLKNLGIFPDKRRQGIGHKAIRAFRVVAEQYSARLGWLRVGSQGDEIEPGLAWRRRFYESDSWVAFKSPPIDGLYVLWMYHDLPPVSEEDKALRSVLVERAAEPDPWLAIRKAEKR